MLQLLESVLPQKAEEADDNFPLYFVDLELEQVDFLLAIVHPLPDDAVHELVIRYLLALQDCFFLLQLYQRLYLGLVLLLVLFAFSVVQKLDDVESAQILDEIPDEIWKHIWPLSVAVFAPVDGYARRVFQVD